MSLLRHFLTILVSLVCVSTAGAVQTQGSKSATARSKPASVKHTSQPVIEFGHQGGNLRPYKVAIYADGRVEAVEGSAPLKGDFIPADKVKELARKATDEGFWKSGPSKKRPALPDFGFVVVRVRTASGRIIYHKGAQIGPLAEYYALLSDAVFQKSRPCSGKTQAEADTLKPILAKGPALRGRTTASPVGCSPTVRLL